MEELLDTEDSPVCPQLQSFEELRENISFMQSQLLDHSALLRELENKESGIRELEFQRDQFLSERQRLLAASNDLPNILEQSTTELHRIRSELIQEQSICEELSQSVAALDTKPDKSAMDLKRLKKQRSVRDGCTTALRQEVATWEEKQREVERQIKTLETEVKLIVELERCSDGAYLATEIEAVEKTNRSLRKKIARCEREMTTAGVLIDAYREKRKGKGFKARKSAAIVQKAATAFSQRYPLSGFPAKRAKIATVKTEEIAPKSKLESSELPKSSPQSINASPFLKTSTPQPVLSFPLTPDQLKAVFHPVSKVSIPRFEAYRSAQHKRDPYYLPKFPVLESSPALDTFRRDLQFTCNLYISTSGCPREHVEILAGSFGTVETETAVSLVVQTLGGLGKDMSSGDAVFLLRTIMRIEGTPDRNVLSHLLSFAICDFYKCRKFTGTRQQWSFPDPKYPYFQHIFALVFAHGAIKLLWKDGLRKLIGLLFLHQNQDLLSYLEGVISPFPVISSLGFLQVFLAADKLPDEVVYDRLLGTDSWELKDRIYALKCFTRLKGPSFLQKCIETRLSPAVLQRAADPEDRSLYMQAIGIAIKATSNQALWKSWRSHLVDTLEAIRSGDVWEETAEFSDAERNCAEAILATCTKERRDQSSYI